MSDDRIAVYPASDADRDFSYQVKKTAEGDLVRRWFGWDEAVQSDFFANEWIERRPSIIWFEGTPVGTVDVRELEDRMEIGRFFILPEYQNRGIGSTILDEALRRADAQGLVVRLAFLNGNRAASLYRRNGFRLVRRTETHSYMERRPERGAEARQKSRQPYGCRAHRGRLSGEGDSRTVQPDCYR